MALTPIEFELSAEQFARMGYPRLRQGEPLSVVLDAGVLLPNDPSADAWFTVQQEPLPTRFEQVWRAAYAFTGQIEEADILGGLFEWNEASASDDAEREAALSEAVDSEQTATLLVNCSGVPLRVTCAPNEDGRLPFGTWESRHLTGVGRLHGIVDDAFESSISQPVGVTLWSFRRLMLTPGDPFFGQWHESSELLDTPFHYDRVVIEARLHRKGV